MAWEDRRRCGGKGGKVRKKYKEIEWQGVHLKSCRDSGKERSRVRGGSGVKQDARKVTRQK